jgi:hypothetical protein
VTVRVMLCMVFATRIASAQPVSEFAAGLAAYRDGNYAVAAAAFEAAFRRDPQADTAFTLAQAHRNQYFIDRDVTRLHRALGLYRHYLLEAPGGRRVPHARMHLETIEAILASLPHPPPKRPAAPPTQLMITAEVPGATVSIDGDAALPVPRVADVIAGEHAIHVTAPGHAAITLQALAVSERLVLVPARLVPHPARITVNARVGQVEIDGRTVNHGAKVSPGEHVISVTARGHRSVVRTIDVAAGAFVAIDIALVPTRQRRVARRTLIGAVGLAGGAAIAGVLAWSAQRDAIALRPLDTRDDSVRGAYNDAVAARDRRRGIATGLALCALAASGTGAALWWFDLPSVLERPAIRPLVGPEAIGIGAGGRF